MKSRICPYRRHCQNECSDCDFSVTFEKQNKKIKNLKRNWENGFQKWSNKQAQDGTNSWGVCGYGSMCEYCEDNTYGRPCVRALNKMCREKWLYIDYSKMTYEEVWSGVSK